MNDAVVKLSVLIDTKDAEKKLNDVEKKQKDFSSKMIAGGAALTGAITLPIVGLVKNGIEYNKQIEQFQVGLTTLLGDSKKASKVMEQIKNDAAKTPFGVTELTKANSLLISAGLDSKKARKDVLALGNAISATGGGADELSRMAVNMQQIKNVGKATALDLKQFAFAGIDIFGLVADYTGKSRKEVKNMEIDYETLTGAMQKASEKGGMYYGAMAKQSQTVAGKTSTLADEYNNAAGELTKTLLPAMNSIVTTLSNLFAWFSKLSGPVKTFILILLGLVALVGPVMTLAGAFSAMGVALNMGLWPVLAIIAGLALLITIIILVIKNFDKIKLWFANFGKWIANWWTVLINGFKKFGTMIGNAIGGAVKGVINFVLKGIITYINGYFKLLNLAIKLINKIPGVKIGQISMLKVPQLAVGTNYVAQDGLAYLHQGEAVVPKKYNPAMGGTGGNMQVTISMPDIIMDGNKVARSVTPFVTRTIKVSGGNV